MALTQISSGCQIIRQEYSDEIYARLAHEAIVLWRTPEWSSNYKETGVVVAVGRSAVQSNYITSALAVNSLPGMETPGLRAYVLETEKDVKGVYPSKVPLGDFARQNVCQFHSALLSSPSLLCLTRCRLADINEAGGWGHARGAVVDTVARLRKAGVRFVAGEASKLIYGTKDGREDVVESGQEQARTSRATLSSFARARGHPPCCLSLDLSCYRPVRSWAPSSSRRRSTYGTRTCRSVENVPSLTVDED